MKEVEEKEEFDLLKAVHGDNIPENLVRIVSPTGDIGYSLGKPDVRKLVNAVLALL